MENVKSSNMTFLGIRFSCGKRQEPQHDVFDIRFSYGKRQAPNMIIRKTSWRFSTSVFYMKNGHYKNFWIYTIEHSLPTVPWVLFKIRQLAGWLYMREDINYEDLYSIYIILVNVNQFIIAIMIIVWWCRSFAAILVIVTAIAVVK